MSTPKDTAAHWAAGQLGARHGCSALPLPNAHQFNQTFPAFSALSLTPHLLFSMWV